MKSSLFKLRKEPSKEVVELLGNTTLGSNGALYQHLNTEERINNLDDPLHLTLQRHEKVLGNVTFCRRNGQWYIRYFAFQSLLQSGGKKRSKASGKSKIKENLKRFFEDTLMNGFEGENVSEFYAYVDPQNVKSLWLTEELGFSTIREIELRTFSRVSPKKHLNILKSNDWDLVPNSILDKLQAKAYFFLNQFKKGKFYIHRNEAQEIVCFAKITKADWKIHRLPGKLGGFLKKVIPFIPGVNRIIRPKKHSFIVPEAVYIKNNDPKLLTEFFSSILAIENRNLILWWADPKEEIYSAVSNKMKWGILNSLVGVNRVNVISKTTTNKKSNPKQTFHISGEDMV